MIRMVANPWVFVYCRKLNSTHTTYKQISFFFSSDTFMSVCGEGGGQLRNKLEVTPISVAGRNFNDRVLVSSSTRGRHVFLDCRGNRCDSLISLLVYCSVASLRETVRYQTTPMGDMTKRLLLWKGLYAGVILHNRGY